MPTRFLSMLVAVAVLVAPCSIVGAEQAFAGKANGAQSVSDGHMHGALIKAPHCPGDPGELERECATDCHSWHVSAAPSLASPAAKADTSATDSVFAIPAELAVDTPSGLQAPLVATATRVLASRGAVFARTERYRL